MRYKYYFRHIGTDAMIEVSEDSVREKIAGPPVTGGRDLHSWVVNVRMETLWLDTYIRFWDLTIFAVKQPRIIGGSDVL